MTSLEQLARLRAQPVDPSHAWVLAAPFRSHVRRLMTLERLPWRVVAELAPVPDPVVRTLVLGREGRHRPKIAGRHARLLMKLDREVIAEARLTMVPASVTACAVRELLLTGHRLTDIARMLDVTPPRADELMTGSPATSALVEAHALAAARSRGIHLAEREADQRAAASWSRGAACWPQAADARAVGLRAA